MRRVFLPPCLAATLLAAACAAVAQAPAPVAAGAAIAIVTDVSGTAVLQRPGRSLPLPVLEALRAGDRLQLAADASAELAFTAGSGQVVALQGPGRFVLDKGDVALVQGSRARLRRRDLAAAWRAVQLAPDPAARASISLRGPGATQVALRAPRGAQMPQSPLRLQWDAPYGRRAATWDYAVQIVDGDGKAVFAAHTPQLGLDLPQSLDLTPEQDYLWTVQARDADGHLVEGAADFRLVDAGVAARMRALQEELGRAQAASADGPALAEQALFALALQDEGLQADALAQWRLLAARRPAYAARALAWP